MLDIIGAILYSGLILLYRSYNTDLYVQRGTVEYSLGGRCCGERESRALVSAIFVRVEVMEFTRIKDSIRRI